MSYYQGDFYQGDPGFFSFLGNIAKTAAGFIPGVGPIASKALSVIPTGGGRAAGAISRVMKSPLARRGVAAVVKHPVLSASGERSAAAEWWPRAWACDGVEG